MVRELLKTASRKVGDRKGKKKENFEMCVRRWGGGCAHFSLCLFLVSNLVPHCLHCWYWYIFNICTCILYIHYLGHHVSYLAGGDIFTI